MKVIFPLLSLLILLTPIHGCAKDLGVVRSDHSQPVSTPGSPGKVDDRPRSVSMNAQEVMNKVAQRYSSLKFYSCRGSNVHKATFDGKEEAPVQTDFAIEYDRGKRGSIEWADGGLNKKFSFDQKTSTTSENGRVTQTFAAPLNGLMTVELAKGGWTLFEINLFVFRDELQLGDVFFRTIQDVTVSDECEVDGRGCYLLSGKFKKGDGFMTYWIDKEDFVVRKTERVLNVKKQTADKMYVRTATTTEQYSEIQIR